MLNLLKIICFLIVFYALPTIGTAQTFEIFAELNELNGAAFEMFAELLIDYENGECSVIQDHGDHQEKMGSGIGFCSPGELYTLGQWNTPSAGILYTFDLQTGEYEFITDALFLHYQAGNPRLHKVACVDNFLFTRGLNSIWKVDLSTEEVSFVGNTTPFNLATLDIGIMDKMVLFGTGHAAHSYLQGIYELDIDNPPNSMRIFPYPQSMWQEYWSRTFVGSPVCNTVFVIRQHNNFGDRNGAFYNVDNHSYKLICDMQSYWFQNITSMAEHIPLEECEAIIDLDAVNVSGAGGYDYLHDEVYTCLTENGLPIAAEKIFIATDETIQEMNVEILSPLVGESLVTLGSVAGIDVAGEGTPSLTLLNSGSVGSAYFIEMIQLINYYNSGESLNEGIRQVRVNFTSTSGKQSNDAYGMIEIVELDSVFLEMDDMVHFCEGGSITLSPVVLP
ncbi:MAG: hypothetical protein EA409_00055, partial [Saprospirales bacterium]